MPTYAQLDSQYALSMMEEAIANPTVKALLGEIAIRLRDAVLVDLKGKEAAGLNPNLSTLIVQHSQGDAALGALLPHYTKEQLSTPEGRLLLLETIEQCLNHASKIESHHDFIALIKVIDGMAFVYDEREKENPYHLQCKEYMAPTPDDVSIRKQRPEGYYAATYGIDTQVGRDLVSPDAPLLSSFSGKARFFILPPAGRMQTQFEKFANHPFQPLPLVAGPSNAAAKQFMVSMGLEFFLKDGQFNLDQAQMFANCVMAYLVYCGHHSFIEVAEMWNRQLHYVAIEHKDTLPLEIFSSEPSARAYMEVADVPERKLPFAVIGGYLDFIHPSYRSDVAARVAEMNAERDWRFSL